MFSIIAYSVWCVLSVRVGISWIADIWSGESQTAWSARTDSRFAPSQWGTALLCNDISHWLGTNLESAPLSTGADCHCKPLVVIDILSSCCPACRTTLIATRFWVVMICPIIKCLTVLRVFFYFVWFVFIHHNFQFYFALCTYCNILDIYLSQNLNFVNYLLFYMKLLNYLFFNLFGSVLECCELTGVSLLLPWLIKWK